MVRLSVLGGYLMNNLASVGGVCVFGTGADKWTQEVGRLIGETPAIFDSDVYSPDTSFGDDAHFELPCHRGQKDYEIHLLESGDAIVLKEGRVYRCTHRDGKPRVLTFDPVPADKQDALGR